MNDDSRIGYANQVYTKQLISVLSEPLYNSLMDIYRKECHMVENKNNILIEFQKKLKDVPNWNQNIIDENVQKASVNCGFLEDLLSAVYFSNVKILSSVKIKKSKSKVHIKLPELDDFIHKTFIEIAKRIYSNPQTFSIKIHGSEMNNKEIVMPFITDAINDAIVKSLPFQNILSTYFGNKLHGDESSSEEESDEESETSDNENNEYDNNVQEEPTECSIPSEQHELPTQTANGFFDRPADNESTEQPEVKEVSIQQPGSQQTPMEKQNPVFFPDAADDPTSEEAD